MASREVEESIYRLPQVSEVAVVGLPDADFGQRVHAIVETADGVLDQAGLNAFLAEKIAPYKGALELWYLAHRSLATDARLVLLTAWVVVRPESTIVYRSFPDLPQRPDWLIVRNS